MTYSHLPSAAIIVHPSSLNAEGVERLAAYVTSEQLHKDSLARLTFVQESIGGLRQKCATLGVIMSDHHPQAAAQMLTSLDVFIENFLTLAACVEAMSSRRGEADGTGTASDSNS